VPYLEDDSGRRYFLENPPVAIGRDDLNAVCLQSDMRVSRRHAELSAREDQWILEDLGSKNGTIVNGRVVHRHPLKDGDKIQIGNSHLRFAAAEDPLSTEIATEAGTLLPPVDLSDRERDILARVSKGMTDKETATELGISVNTVRSHLDRIREKTGLRKRSELTRLAVGLEQGSPP
jgi:pSer/pThr/pTyr-binding forkhead associated (FHA) protein